MQIKANSNPVLGLAIGLVLAFTGSLIAGPAAIAPANDVATVQIEGETVLVISGEQGILNASIPEATRQEMLADWLMESDPQAVYFVNPRAAEEIEWSVAAGKLSPYLEERLAGCEEDCKCDDVLEGCGDKIRTKSKTYSFNWVGSPQSSVNGAFTGTLTTGANLSGSGTAEVTYKIKRKKIIFVCVPYWVKFVNARAFGSAQLETDSAASGSISYTNNWSWSTQLSKPSLGSISFWVGPIPVHIGFNLPITAGLRIEANASASVHTTGELQANGSFDYTCTLDGCSGTSGFASQSPTGAQLTAALEGRVLLRPHLDVAVRAYLYDEDVAYAQVGVRPTLYADLWGYYGNNCGDADGDGVNETVEALTLDLDGQLFVTGKAKLLGDTVWSSDDVWHTSRTHLWWTEIADSSALNPMLPGPASGYRNEQLSFGAMMRPCYPYNDSLNMRFEWGDGTQTTLSTGAHSPEYRSHSWSSLGYKNVVLRALSDNHGRTFGASTNRSILIRPYVVNPPGVEQ